MCGNSVADQRLCLHYKSTILLIPKSNFSSLKPSSMTVQHGLCRTWSETPKTGFLVMRITCKTLPMLIGSDCEMSLSEETDPVSVVGLITGLPDSVVVNINLGQQTE